MSSSSQSPNSWLSSAVPLGVICAYVAARQYLRKKHGPGSEEAPEQPLPPKSEEGQLLVRQDSVANRILSVGDLGRALRVAAACFDDGVRKEVHSTRGFRALTGLFQGVPVTILATGMGLPMMDFVVRESRQVVSGEMAMVRLGTCGGLNGAREGDFAVCRDGAVLIRREPDAMHHFHLCDDNDHGRAAALSSDPRAPTSDRPYSISKPVPSDPELTHALITALNEGLSNQEEAPTRVREGLAATADSFYGSQGRASEHFDDRNGELLDHLLAIEPGLRSLEMEHFQLLDLAASSKGSIRATAASIVLIARKIEVAIDHEKAKRLELLGGRAALQALVRTPLVDEMPLEDFDF